MRFLQFRDLVVAKLQTYWIFRSHSEAFIRSPRSRSRSLPGLPRAWRQASWQCSKASRMLTNSSLPSRIPRQRRLVVGMVESSNRDAINDQHDMKMETGLQGSAQTAARHMRHARAQSLKTRKRIENVGHVARRGVQRIHAQKRSRMRIVVSKPLKTAHSRPSRPVPSTASSALTTKGIRRYQQERDVRSLKT